MRLASHGGLPGLKTPLRLSVQRRDEKNTQVLAVAGVSPSGVLSGLSTSIPKLNLVKS